MYGWTLDASTNWSMIVFSTLLAGTESKQQKQQTKDYTLPGHAIGTAWAVFKIRIKEGFESEECVQTHNSCESSYRSKFYS
ncbi:hypothetical protein Dsin_011681 [Dipteronia sinensis]|uniref:Secreted protein n=1 Tax=Dipteronia sinensis TaxID=43782 RepID=A0AAE0AGV7_9ROSI|nr:hypothetical protein Dsin_011681 [Dipteronia sinensis]